MPVCLEKTGRQVVKFHEIGSMPTEVEEGYKQKLSIDVIYSFPVLLVGM